MAPVLHDPPLCRMAELADGTYTIDDLADMHEAMAEEAEYHRRWQVAMERERKRKERT